MKNKIFISANQLLEDAFELGTQVLQGDFHPDLIIGVWRGGAPVAMAINELLNYAGVNADHVPIRTQLYTGLEERAETVSITGLEYIADRSQHFNKILLVDDVFDSGQTMTALVDELTEILSDQFGKGHADIRIATTWYKPAHNESQLKPDYFIHTTESWLVFPHELCGIDKAELIAHKPGIKMIKDILTD